MLVTGSLFSLQTRYDTVLFPSKMALMDDATDYYGTLNGGNMCVGVTASAVYIFAHEK